MAEKETWVSWGYFNPISEVINLWLYGVITLYLLLMEEILHQFIGSVPIIYKVLYISGGAGFLPSTV